MMPISMPKSIGQIPSKGMLTTIIGIPGKINPIAITTTGGGLIGMDGQWDRNFFGQGTTPIVGGGMTWTLPVGAIGMMDVGGGRTPTTLMSFMFTWMGDMNRQA